MFDVIADEAPRQVIYGIACDGDMKPHELGRRGAFEMNGFERGYR